MWGPSLRDHGKAGVQQTRKVPSASSGGHSAPWGCHHVLVLGWESPWCHLSPQDPTRSTTCQDPQREAHMGVCMCEMLLTVAGTGRSQALGSLL